MSGDSFTELKDNTIPDPNEVANRERLVAEALRNNHSTNKQKFALTASPLLEQEKKTGLSVETKQGIANFAGTMSASISGTMAWSIADKALGNSRYGLAAKLAASMLVGGSTRVALKGGTELMLLDAKDRTTGFADFAWGGVDALAAVGAVKAENAFSTAWKKELGKSSGAHLSAELLQQQGKRILDGDLKHRIFHNTARGIVGGGTGALLWSTPHELVNNFDKLNTLEGWKKTSDDIAKNTLFGGAFGGVLFGGGTVLWNARELAGLSKAAIQGKQGRYSLNVLHFNDGHSSVLGDRSTLPQLASKAEELRRASNNAKIGSIVADLGDAHSGNAAAIVSNTGELEQRLINQHVKVDALIPGNHVTDAARGKANDAVQWIKNMKQLNLELSATGREVPGLAANVQTVLEPQFISKNGIYKPYRIFVDPHTGDKVGLVGLVTDHLQGAAPKLLDGNLAVAAQKYGNMTWKELSTSLDHANKVVVEGLAQNSALQKILSATPEIKLADAIEQLVQKQYLSNLGTDAQQAWRNWFQLAGKHPASTLKELAAHQQSNEALSHLASLYPEKRIADLHQAMVSNPKEALEQAVNALHKEGVNKVVVLSHMGRAADLKLAKEGPQVAAFIGGHSHDLEPRPLFIKNTSTGNDVLVTQAGHSYGWLGETKIVFNRDGSVNRYLSSGKMHVIDESVPAMKSAQEAVNKHMSSSPEGQDLLRQVSQRHPIQVDTEVPLDYIRGQLGKQTPLANLLVNAFKEGGDKALAQVNATRVAHGLPRLGNQVDAVLVQSGGIRAGLPAGQLDELTLQTMFMNKPALVEMSGAEIQNALSYGVHDMPPAATPKGALGKAWDLLSSFKKEVPPLVGEDVSGKNIIAGQLRFNVDRSLPTNGRVTGVEILDAASGKYVPIDPNKRYTVMTVTHLLGRWGNTPLVPAKQLRNMSLESLGPEFWVFGKRLEPSTVTSLLKPSELPSNASRDFLLDYLTSQNTAGKFALPKSLLESPMQDISPGAWVPPLRPSLSASAVLGALSAKDK